MALDEDFLDEIQDKQEDKFIGSADYKTANISSEVE